jgi:hypothetical protein
MLLPVACQLACSWLHSSRIDDITDLLWLLILQHRRWAEHCCHVICMCALNFCACARINCWHSDSLSEDSYTKCDSSLLLTRSELASLAHSCIYLVVLTTFILCACTHGARAHPGWSCDFVNRLARETC